MKQLLLLLLALFLWAGSSLGQITVTIGTGTSITTGTTPTVTPYKTYWQDGQDQYLYTKAELNAAGLGAGNITKLAFNVGGTPSTGTLNGFTIFMQHTTLTSHTTFVTSGWTQCYTGNVIAVTGWNTYTFTTPFNWDGTSNLLIKVCFHNIEYTSTTHVYYTTTPSTVHPYWYGDIGSGCDQTVVRGNGFRPNVQITGQPNITPVLSVFPSSLGFGYIASGNTSPKQTYVLSSTYLTAGPIVVTAPPGFEVSLAPGSGFGNSVSVSYTPPTLANTTIYVRFVPTTPNTEYSGNITNVGGSASANVAVTGTTWEFKKMYCYVAQDLTSSLPEGPAYFYANAPGTITSLAPTTSDQFIDAGTWADGVWYGSEYYDATGHTGGGWWTINPTNGVMTKIADFDKGFAGLAYNKNTNTMYGVEWTGTTNNLYTINRFTGVFTFLGSFGTGPMINLASDGINLYSININDDKLYKIDPSVPNAVAVGPTGFDFSYSQGMEYDYDNNIMYVCGYTTTGQFMTANLTTGACTLIGGFQGGSEITGFAIPYIPPMPGRQLSLNLLIEGLHDGLRVMHEAMNYNGTDFVPKWGAGIADQITVKLVDRSTGAVVYTAHNVALNTDGTALANVPAVLSGEYFIYILNRNCITIASAVAVLFSTPTISYDFTSNSMDTYSSNVKNVGGYFCMFSGDITDVSHPFPNAPVQDGVIDIDDSVYTYDNVNNGSVGYLPDDVDGNGVTEIDDVYLVYDNIILGVSAQLPF
jgi:hypothetical protein